MPVGRPGDRPVFASGCGQVLSAVPVQVQCSKDAAAAAAVSSWIRGNTRGGIVRCVQILPVAVEGGCDVRHESAWWTCAGGHGAEHQHNGNARVAGRTPCASLHARGALPAHSKQRRLFFLRHVFFVLRFVCVTFARI